MDVTPAHIRNTEPLVKFLDVEKSYDGRTLAVRDLTLEVARAEFLTLLGPSGSGKTTTLNMLAGFERPTRGEILLGGRPVDRLPPYERNIGMVFQNYALFPHMTVGENVAFPLSVRRIRRAEIAERVRRALAMVRLEAFADRRPAQLSGGQQQRIALARALVFEPSLVLMDEPLGALDKKLREQMQIEIKLLHERFGLTVVYVTHDQSEALTMSDRIAVFHDGRVVQQGTPDLLYSDPSRCVRRGLHRREQSAGRYRGCDRQWMCTRRARCRLPGNSNRSGRTARPRAHRRRNSTGKRSRSLPVRMARKTPAARR